MSYLYYENVRQKLVFISSDELKYKTVNKTEYNYIDLDLKEYSKEVAPLIVGLVSEQSHERKDARKKLVNMGKDIVPQIHKTLFSKNKLLKWEAARTIKEIGDASSIPVFIQLLEDPESDIRWIAAEGLINAGRESIVPLLKEIMAKGDSHYIRNGVHHVFRELFDDVEKKLFHQLQHALQHYTESSEFAQVEAAKAIGYFSRLMDVPT